MDNYDSRQRWAKMLTIGVALVVVFGWMLGLLGGIAAGRENPPHPDPLPTGARGHDGSPNSSEEQSLSKIIQNARQDISSRTQMMHMLWTQALAQLKHQQSFAQYFKEKINSNHNSP